MSKAILVTGATGKQGGAVINALLASPRKSSYILLALTRAPESASAKALMAKSSSIKLIKGDLNDVPAVFAAAKDALVKSKSGTDTIHGVFSVQVPMGKGQTPESEEVQGKAMVDAAVKANVKHFIYSSVDRGHDSINNPTNVPHFISKHNVEKHLLSAASKHPDMKYTILRTVAFMENWTNNFMGAGFGSMFAVGVPATTKVQLLSVTDIGVFAAKAFDDPQAYSNRSLSIAGDDLTLSEADAIFKAKTGQPAPRTFGLLGRGLLWSSKELGTMFNFFRTQGFGADIPALRKEHPDLLDLGRWIETKSDWAKK